MRRAPCSKGDGPCISTRKAKFPIKPTSGFPKGSVEEEHGREGFTGPVSHLYRTHPPTGWVKIEGPLKPRAFACAQFSVTLTPPGTARPILMMQSQDASLYLSIHTADDGPFRP